MKNFLFAATCAATLTGFASAQQWLDNFNDGSAVDGSPVMWTPSPAFASQFNVVAGDMVMSMPPGTFPAISSARVPVNFASGASVRARMVASVEPGRFAVALADEPTGIKGYVASFSTCGGGRLELFRGDVIGAIVFIGAGVVPWPYSPLEEHYLQLDVFNGVVSARVWRPGEPFPSAQISALDSTYAGGVASIAIQDFGDGDCTFAGTFDDVSATIRFAQASSTPLTHSGIGDITADGSVNIDDLLQVINAWGSCTADSRAPTGGCRGDVNGDADVNIDDLLLVINNWG